MRPNRRMAGQARYQMRTEAAGHRELARYVAPGQHQDRGASVPARRQRNPLGTPAEPGHGRRSRLGHSRRYDHRAKTIDFAQAGHSTLVCGTAVSQAAIRAGLPANRIATTVSGVEFRWRDVTIKSLPTRHESTMTINEQFVADQPESFLLSTTTDSRISCGDDVSISQDLKTWAVVAAQHHRRGTPPGTRVRPDDHRQRPPGHAAVRGPVRHSGDTRSRRLRTRP